MTSDADRNAMREALPELGLIADEGLRAKVLETLTVLWRDSDWDDLFAVPYLTDLPSVSWVQHTRFVAAAAASAADHLAGIVGQTVDKDLVVAGALLHDGSKFQEYARPAEGDEGYDKSELGNKLPHSLYAAHVALNQGLPLDVVHIIATHTPMTFLKPQRPEGWLVREADALMLEALINKSSEQYVSGYFGKH